MNPGYLNLLPPAAGKIGDVAYRVVGKPARQTIVCETTVNGTKYICTRPVSDIKNWFKGKTITEKCHKMQLIRKDGSAIEVPTLQKKNHKYYDAFEPLIRVTNLLNERIMRVMETNFYSTVVKKDGEEVTLRSLYTSREPRFSVKRNSKYPPNIYGSQNSVSNQLLEKLVAILESPEYSDNKFAQQLLEKLKEHKENMAKKNS